jgi:putative PIN family toxin of toxin-antitoxin system
MRVVADTNIVISGLLWRGYPHQILNSAREGAIDLFTTAVLLAELEDVLSREKFAERLEAAGINNHDLVLGYAALASVIEPITIEPVILADPDDDAVLACALAGRCEVIVSGDSHLLDVRRHQGIRIITAAELVLEIQNS